MNNTVDQSSALRLRKPERSQVVMKMASAEELVAEGHAVRVVWRVVEALERSGDLSGFTAAIKAREGAGGRDATSPALLIAVWLYASTRGVGSARELAKLCLESRPYMWLCGGVTLNHHLLSDFRVGHREALDKLFTRVIALLAGQKLVKVYRISQDGLRVRACAGASSFRRSERLGGLLDAAKAHVAELSALLEDPERSAGLSAKRKAAKVRAARERQQRLERAIAALPALEEKRKKLAKKVSAKDKAKKLREPRASTTDAEAKVMKMADGGFRPALNVQFAVDTQSRAILRKLRTGVDVVSEGNDHHLSEPMRKQVEERTGQKVQEHLMDGGFLVKDDVEKAAENGVTLYVPPKPPRNTELRGSEYEPMEGESQTLADWRARMGSDEGKAIYKERASTSETVNADVRTHRGLNRLLVRGIEKALSIALWAALAYNVMHFGPSLVA